MHRKEWRKQSFLKTDVRNERGSDAVGKADFAKQSADNPADSTGETITAQDGAVGEADFTK